MNNKKLFYQYLSFATQLICYLIASVGLGWWVDKWLKLKIPLTTIVLPIIVLIVVFIKVFKDTNTKK